MARATIHVDTREPIGRIDPKIYGHFIEHLGRCITGGIWAEMLRSRRFVGFDDDHNGLADPWEKRGGRAPQLLVETEPGRLTMRCLRDTGESHAIAHPGLAVRGGERYHLSLPLRASGGISEIEVSLAGASEVRGVAEGDDLWDVELTPHWDADDEALVIGCRGEGRLTLGPPSLMAARDRETGGYRADVLALVAAIEPPIIRWPGGCFADGYRWRDGVGERGQRPARFDPAWQAWDDNDFGTVEFVDFCRRVGAEPYICVNTGSADAASAAEWVLYCRERELGVRYWGVGNETYGSWEIGNVPADEYARLFLEFADVMRKADSDIELIAVGADPVRFPDWNRTVLEIAGEQMDHLSVHRYVPHHRDDDDGERQYAAIVAAPMDVERRLRMVARTIDEVLGDGSGVKIAFDEWNVWLDADRSNDLEEQYELRDALFAAGVFNVLHRMCGELSMANLAQLVNVLPAINTSRTGAWATPIYRAFELYARHCGEIALPCRCECETFDADEFGNIPSLSNVPWLDASATASEDGSEIVVAVVNRHPTETMAAEIRVEGTDRARVVQQAVLNGASAATTSRSNPGAVDIHVTSIDPKPLPLSRRLPPHSVTLLTLRE